jgi:type I restriction enzyme S subunit
MTMSDTIKPGYKRTKIGVIPEDWDVVLVSNQFNFVKTYSNSRGDLSDSGEIEYLHYGDIHTKYYYHLNLDRNILPKLMANKIEESPSYMQEGDLIIVDASEDYTDIGKSVEVQNISGTSYLVA